ncbi:MAG: phosphatidate cytidylyltransferase [Sphingobacteriales bacterium]|nr:phosphatidate cytidylyltransferase [Sphingobacteriales bacterium]
MAFNWQTFQTRALTAVVFVAVMLTGLLWNHWSFFILFSLIHFGCWWEYFKLTEKNYQAAFHIYTKLGFMLLGYGLMLWFCGDAYRLGNYLISDNFSLPVSAAGFILAITGIFRQGPLHLHAFGMALLGIFYISLSWGMMISLYTTTDLYLRSTYFVFSPGTLPILVIAGIWINDTMAYIVGSLIGKTPLSKVSPKKTWEGTVGGIVLAVVVTGLLAPLIMTGRIGQAYFVFVASVALLAAVTGTFGDLLESKLKRMAGVKDSGSLMPGHGGFLDRFDSLLPATVFVWIYIQLLRV